MNKLQRKLILNLPPPLKYAAAMKANVQLYNFTSNIYYTRCGAKSFGYSKYLPGSAGMLIPHSCVYAD